MNDEPKPTAALAWHAMRATARRILETHPLEVTGDVPPDLPIASRATREQRREYWKAVTTRLAVFEIVVWALALDVGSHRKALAYAEHLERSTTTDPMLAGIATEMAIAVRQFADTRKDPT